MNKKYLFFITGMEMGGAERVLSTLANQFVENGDQVRIVLMKEKYSAYALDERVELVGGDAFMRFRGIGNAMKSIASILKAIRFYEKQIDDFQPDLILSFLTYTNLVAVLKRKKAGRNCPVIISERCDPRERSKAIIWLTNHFYPKADCIVCQSTNIEEYFKTVNPVSKTVVIPNLVNSECISDRLPNQRKKKIIAAGRLNNQKNYDLLINAFEEIKEKISEYRVEIYGKGPEEERLRRVIDSKGLADRIHLMGTKDNVMRNEADAALYVMTSDFEGFPNALAEAMCSGIPVISTDFPTGTARELIQNGVNGYVVPCGDKKALSEAMLKILCNPSLQESMGKANFSKRNVLGVAHVFNLWESTFDKVCLLKGIRE